MCVGCTSRLNGLEFDADCRHTFWVEHPLCLLSSFKIIPSEDMTLEEKMNAITRIIIIVFIVMLIIKFKHALTFLIVSLIIIILMYYSRKRFLVREEKLRQKLSKIDRKTKNHNNDRSDDNKYHNDYSNDDSHDRFYVEAGNKTKDSRKNTEKKYYGANQEAPREAEKKHPRKPYPSTVPSDIEIKNGKPFGTNFGTKANQERVPVQFRPNFRLEEEEGEDENEDEDKIEAERERNMSKAYKGGDQSRKRQGMKYYGYQPRDFQDEPKNYVQGYAGQDANQAMGDVEVEYAEEGDEYDPDLIVNRRERYAPNIVLSSNNKPPVASSSTNQKPKRMFLPSNYEYSPSEDKPGPRELEISSHSAGRGVRRVAKWNDVSNYQNKIDAAQIMFAKAAKLEKETKIRSQIDRSSHINSIFAT